MYQTRNLIGLLQQFSIFLILGVVAGVLAANLDPHLYEEMVDYHVFGEIGRASCRERV